MNFDNFPERLKEVMTGESNYSFGEKCEVSEGTLRRYLRGDTYPPLDTLARIAEVSGYSLGWLASGEGPKKQGDTAITTGGALHEELLQAVMEAVEGYLDEIDGHLPAKKKAQLVAALYDLFSDDEEQKVDKATVIRLVKLAA